MNAAPIAGTLLPGFAGPTAPDWLLRRLRDGLAGVCLFGTNIRSRSQVHDLVASLREANPRAVIAIDEEGGDVTRLYYDVGSPYPGNAALGRLDDPAMTEHVARIVGWELRLAGIDLNLAPDADVNSNPRNPVIGTRSFGADPALVARHTAAWITGLQSTGVAASAKHFPGHGDTEQDSHLALPTVRGDRAALRARELVPFVAAIAAGARTIMSSHILLPDVDPDAPATFSRRVLVELLREELGFTGVVVSDALDMAGASATIGIPAAAVRALLGGCELLCIGVDTTEEQLKAIESAVDGAIADGRLSVDQITEAAATVALLADESARLRSTIEIPDFVTASDEPSFDRERFAAIVEAAPDLVVREQHEVIAVETTANIAVGSAPWGPRAVDPSVRSVPAGEAATLRPGVQPILAVIGAHRDPLVLATIAAAKAENPETIVVEMGWPDAERRHADVVTWGSSRFVGQVLLDWLDARVSGEVHP
ncbi:MAG: glycoside hydrolase family 3 protein [Microcella sp.]